MEHAQMKNEESKFAPNNFQPVFYHQSVNAKHKARAKYDKCDRSKFLCSKPPSLAVISGTNVTFPSKKKKMYKHKSIR